jgi:sRNA-binding carbon storage regulator CsrA
MDKAELVITVLQQRIGELVSNYETQIAILRAEITELIQEKQNKEKAINDYSLSVENILNKEAE